ncbi:MAG: peptidyl-prolyl cis-trans isomerase [Phycisphaeraceae bacterium]|nr:peptidyl-prolyl cis-trans isomerase [Phycisphaeraceae bacterium]
MLLIILGFFATGCGHTPRQAQSTAPTTAPSATAGTAAGTVTGAAPGAVPGAVPGAGKPLALLAGQNIRMDKLQPLLLEAAGGEALIDLVLDHQIQRQLAQRALTVTPEQIQAERDILLGIFSSDADQAQRLLDELRRRRGLGPHRFEQLLRRNAGLRQLVQPQVQVTETATRQAYAMAYGQRKEARVLVVSTVRDAAEYARRAKAGEDFATLAREHSTDASADAGGLMTPISEEDPQYPAAVRSVLAKLEPGQISDPIALDQGFAVLRCERTIPAVAVEYESVKTELELGVRRRIERMLMSQTARAMLDEADLTVLDPTLAESWKQARRLQQQQP